jgi:large subunit ribosomal protein L21
LFVWRIVPAGTSSSDWKKPVRASLLETGFEREDKMFAVIKTGGKQYRVAANDRLQIEKLVGEAGETVTFSDVLMLGGDTPQIGAPLVAGASVTAEIVEHKRGRKVIVFKKRRRQNSRRKNGHRQDFTVVRITDIMGSGSNGSRSAVQAAPAQSPNESTSVSAEATPEGAQA